MASQTMGNNYNKMARAWDKKRGTRDCQANVFQGTTAKEPLYHVPSLLNRAFCDIHKHTDIAKELKSIEPNAVIVSPTIRGVWIYDMRASDAAPRTEQDATRLKWIVSLFIKKHFEPHTQQYLLEHIAISMCFFAWFFATPNYFYATKEMRQTTRYGIEKIWTETLLRKQPTATPPPKQNQTKQRGAMHQKNMLPKLEEEKRALETKIEALVPTQKFDWTDMRDVHTKVSDCFDMNSPHYIVGKKSKKLQALHQEHQKIQEKVGRMKKGIAHAEFQEQHRQTEKGNTEDVPSIPPKAELEPEEPEEPEEEAPDSWEDLLL